jgi:hypothetical protein
VAQGKANIEDFAQGANMNNYTITLRYGNVTFNNLTPYKFDDDIEFSRRFKSWKAVFFGCRQIKALLCKSVPQIKVPCITIGLCCFGRNITRFSSLHFVGGDA